MQIPKKMAALGLAAGLVGGGAAGAVLSGSGVSGAAPTAVVQDDAPADGAERPDPGTHIAEALAPLVDAGTISQEQADAVATALQDARPEGRRGHKGGNGETLAAALGLTTDELREALSDGSTVADVAAAQGVDDQSVIDTLVAEAQTRLQEAVDSEKLTQEEADEKLAGLTERITDSVNNGRPERGEGGQRGPRGPGGPGGNRAPDAPAEGES
jgi:hypothetical protein